MEDVWKAILNQLCTSDDVVLTLSPFASESYRFEYVRCDMEGKKESRFAFSSGGAWRVARFIPRTYFHKRDIQLFEDGIVMAHGIVQLLRPLTICATVSVLFGNIVKEHRAWDFFGKEMMRYNPYWKNERGVSHREFLRETVRSLFARQRLLDQEYAQSLKDDEEKSKAKTKRSNRKRPGRFLSSPRKRQRKQ